MDRTFPNEDTFDGDENTMEETTLDLDLDAYNNCNRNRNDTSTSTSAILLQEVTSETTETEVQVEMSISQSVDFSKVSASHSQDQESRFESGKMLETNVMKAFALLRTNRELKTRSKVVEDELERGKEQLIHALLSQLASKKNDSAIIEKCIEICEHIRGEYERCKREITDQLSNEIRCLTQEKAAQCEVGTEVYTCGNLLTSQHADGEASVRTVVAATTLENPSTASPAQAEHLPVPVVMGKGKPGDVEYEAPISENLGENSLAQGSFNETPAEELIRHPLTQSPKTNIPLSMEQNSAFSTTGEKELEDAESHSSNHVFEKRNPEGVSSGNAATEPEDNSQGAILNSQISVIPESQPSASYSRMIHSENIQRSLQSGSLGLERLAVSQVGKNKRRVHFEPPFVAAKAPKLISIHLLDAGQQQILNPVVNTYTLPGPDISVVSKQAISNVLNLPAPGNQDNILTENAMSKKSSTVPGEFESQKMTLKEIYGRHTSKSSVLLGNFDHESKKALAEDLPSQDGKNRSKHSATRVVQKANIPGTVSVSSLDDYTPFEIPQATAKVKSYPQFSRKQFMLQESQKLRSKKQTPSAPTNMQMKKPYFMPPTLKSAVVRASSPKQVDYSIDDSSDFEGTQPNRAIGKT